jgi:hypothetical protein
MRSAPALFAITLIVGCANALGLEPWHDPLGGGGSAGAPPGVLDTDDASATGATCANGIVDGDESDVDCGGPCTPCADGKRCHHDADCAGGSCGPSKVCGADGGASGCEVGDAPSCHDCLKNGNETSVDCGGSCPPCGASRDCKVDADCITASCVGGVCAQVSASGPCRDDSDCLSGLCVPGPCATGSCCQ